MLWFKCDEIIPGVAIAIAFLAVCLGGFLHVYESTPVENISELCSMAEGGEENIETFKTTGKTALIIGYTGETGSKVLEMINENKLFKKVILVGRREVTFSKDYDRSVLEQRKVNFDNLDAFTEAFEGADVCFCCIGTTRAKAGSSEAFVKVDHDYVLKSAELLKNSGCKHFQVMSTASADHKSNLLYTRTKGQVEEALKVMHFERLSIFRPGVLMVDRRENRPMERLARFFLVPVSKLFPTALSVPVDAVARAMIYTAVTPSDKTVEVFENKAIHVMSGEYNICPKSETKTDQSSTSAETAKTK